MKQEIACHVNVNSVSDIRKIFMLQRYHLFVELVCMSYTVCIYILQLHCMIRRNYIC